MIKLTRWKQLEGTGYGLNSPILIIDITIKDADQKTWLHINKALGHQKHLLFNHLEDAVNYTISSLLNAINKLQKLAGIPSFEKGKILNRIQLDASEYKLQLAIPYFSYSACLETIKWLCKASKVDIKSDPNLSKLVSDIGELTSKLQRFAPAGNNTVRFLKAAHQLNIAWLPISHSIFQFGYGKNSHWLDSSFSQNTSVIAARIAKNKLLTTEILRNAGYPVVEHHRAYTINEAAEIANQLSYPVVIKPMDKDSGAGVTANIQNQIELRKGFNLAQRVSRKILVEKHLIGVDHRIYIFNGKVIGGIARIPGGVTGDGKSTILDLLTAINANPLRGRSPTSPLEIIELDDEAHQLLNEQKLTIDSIPKIGQFVPLRNTSNINRGGTALKIKHIHPDNKKLLESAVKLLKLDIAGVDLIANDIGKSWHEEPVSICEINAQPQLGGILNKHLYVEILQKLVPNNGQLSTVLVINGSGESILTQQITEYWHQHGITSALATDGGVYINNELSTFHKNWFSASRSAIKNQDIEALIINCTAKDINRTGLPLNKIDMLVIEDREASSKSDISAYQLLFSQKPTVIISPVSNVTSQKVAKHMRVEKQLLSSDEDLFSIACSKFRLKTNN